MKSELTNSAIDAWSLVETDGYPSAPVDFIVDGLYLRPREYAQILLRMTEADNIAADHYSNGGVIERIEEKFAGLLGKQRAVFLPTGTLANHLAIRRLAGQSSKIIVQAESHLYNDSGDSSQRFSGLNLVPLAPGRASFTVEEVQSAIDRADAGRVATRVAAMSIETPVRRRFNASFPYEDMRRVISCARENDIAVHLDGARLFIESVHTGIALEQYADLFDSVYISLYKCFNASAGAILAGSHEMLDDLYHARRAFGGSLAQAWPSAALAMNFVDGFMEHYGTAWDQAEKLFAILEKSERFYVEKVPNGTHIVKLHLLTGDLMKFRKNLYDRNILLSERQTDWRGFELKINPSLNRASAEQIAEEFLSASKLS